MEGYCILQILLGQPFRRLYPSARQTKKTVLTEKSRSSQRVDKRRSGNGEVGIRGGLGRVVQESNELPLE